MSRTKHVDIKYHLIRNLHEEGIIELKYVPTNQMVADIMTKPLPKADFLKHRSKLLESTDSTFEA